MAGDDWLSLIVLGILGLGAYGVARAKGKSDEEAMDTVRGAGENVADYMQKKSDEHMERIEREVAARKRYYDRYDTNALKSMWRNRDSLSGIDKRAIRDLLEERGEY